VQLVVTRALSPDLFFLVSEFNPCHHSIRINKPSLNMFQKERNFVRSLTSYDMDMEWKNFRIDVSTCIMRGLIVMKYQKDAYFFHIDGEKEWTLKGCHIHGGKKCKSLYTSDIPQHWQLFKYGSGCDSNEDNFALHMDDFSQNMREFAVFKCCDKLNVSIDWNDIPFQMRYIHVRMKESNMLQKFGFLFDVNRLYADFSHKRVSIALQLQLNNESFASFYQMVQSFHINKVFQQEELVQDGEPIVRFWEK